MNLEKIKNAKTSYLGKEIIYQEEMESTQEVAKQLAKENGKNGTIIITENQTKGRGTKGRSWITSKGKNITMTIFVRQNFNIAQLEGFTIRIAEAIKEAIEELYSYSLTIKKPNDLLLKGKKIAGILTETAILKESVNYLLIGIGFNVNEEKFSKELRKYCHILKKRIGKGI